MILLICVLLTRISHKSIHALQRFLFGTHFVALACKKMPPCPHLNSIEEVNVEEIKRKMKEVCLNINFSDVCEVMMNFCLVIVNIETFLLGCFKNNNISLHIVIEAFYLRGLMKIIKLLFKYV